MIYLFNSAYRALYTRNVLNTLFIPKGGTNEYRYRARGAITHIAADSYSDFVNAASNEPVAVTFIDRFGDTGYVYHPLRIGRLVKCREEQDRLFFRISLEDFVYPRDIGRFNRAITQSLGPRGLPCLRGNDPFKADDGYYAIKAGSLFTTVNDFHWGDDAWKNAVENLRITRAFSEVSHPDVARQEEDIAPREFIFVKCDICSQSTQRELVVPKLRKDMAVFDLLRGERYEFLLSYRYPPQLTNTSCAAKVETEFGENLRALGSISINIDSYSNSVPLPFATKRHLEDNEDGVSFKFTSSRPKSELVGPDARLLFRFKESKSFWVKLVLLVLSFSTLSVLIGTDIIIGIKILAGIFQGIVIVLLFRLMGKKFL
jgi:hypothetical protein